MIISFFDHVIPEGFQSSECVAVRGLLCRYRTIVDRHTKDLFVSITCFWTVKCMI